MGKLNILSGNILDYLDGIDAIVNSNNQYMISGSGVCGLIYKKANVNKLEKYCKDKFKEKMKINEVRITPGFDLGVDIIHIYCPKYYESKNPIEDLKQSYISIFGKASKKGYKNIISVSIGTGIHGYKHHEIYKEIIDILKELVVKYNICFNLVLPDEELFDLYNTYSL